MFPCPQEQIHSLNTGLVPDSSPKDSFADAGWILHLIYFFVKRLISLCLACPHAVTNVYDIDIVGPQVYIDILQVYLCIFY